MHRLVRLLTAARARLRAEDGGFMIEIVVSAALLVTAGGGVLMAMDAATAQSGEQRLQAVAADVGQAEMEWLRSQKFDTLTALDRTQNVASSGTTFTVRSTSAWAMQAPPGSTSCTNSGRNPEALRITATVTWPNMRRKPVALNSLVAAPAGSSGQRGAFVVQVTNRDGAGIQGVPVTLAGPVRVDGPTDVNGCVRFSEIQAGSYQIQFSYSGHITPSGQSSIDKTVDVVAGQTRSDSFEIDRPGSAQLRWVFHNGSSSTAASTPPPWATFDHARMSPSRQSFAVTGPGQIAPTWLGPALYPFTSAYAIYADQCVWTSGNPPVPQPSAGTVTIPQGGSAGTVNVRLAGLDVDPADANPGDLAYVKTQCGTIVGPRSLTGSNGSARLVDGWPYGTVEVCVVRGTRWTKRTGVANTNTNGVTLVRHSSFDINPGTTSSPRCGDASWGLG